MDKFKISGPRPLAGKKPGETVTIDELAGCNIDAVTIDELAGCNIDALLQGGHLTPATPTKAPKAINPEEQ